MILPASLRRRTTGRMISSTGLQGKLYAVNKVAFEVAISATFSMILHEMISQKFGELERNGLNLEYPHVSKCFFFSFAS